MILKPLKQNKNTVLKANNVVAIIKFDKNVFAILN